MRGLTLFEKKASQFQVASTLLFERIAGLPQFVDRNRERTIGEIAVLHIPRAAEAVDVSDRGLHRPEDVGKPAEIPAQNFVLSARLLSPFVFRHVEPPLREGL